MLVIVFLATTFGLMWWSDKGSYSEGGASGCANAFIKFTYCSIPGFIVAWVFREIVLAIFGVDLLP